MGGANTRGQGQDPGELCWEVRRQVRERRGDAEGVCWEVGRQDLRHGGEGGRCVDCVLPQVRHHLGHRDGLDGDQRCGLVDIELGNSPQMTRCPFLESYCMIDHNSDDTRAKDDVMKELLDNPLAYADNLQGRRIFKTHLPFDFDRIGVSDGFLGLPLKCWHFFIFLTLNPFLYSKILQIKMTTVPGKLAQSKRKFPLR